MRASILEILTRPQRYAKRVLHVDGILLVTDFDGATSRFQHVWLLQPGETQKRALRLQAFSSNSALWHGLSRLNPRHLPGMESFRIHDAVRACLRLAATPADGQSQPPIELLTAIAYRRDFTLYVGADGVSLDQVLPAAAAIQTLPDIQANIARHLGRRCYVYGTLVIRSSPPAQFLLPGKIPFAAADGAAARLARGEFKAEWLADIEYPQADSAPPPTDALPESIHIDAEYDLKERLSALPGINQTIVKPAIALGSLAARDQAAHFATLTEIEQVFLQNISYGGGRKAFESVLKLKNFEALTAAS